MLVLLVQAVFHYFIRFIAVGSNVSICLVCDSSTWPSIPAARFAFCLCFIRFVFVVCSSFLVN